MPNSSTRMVTLKSSDGKIFMVEESVAVQSRTIKNRIEGDCAGKIIPIQNVSGKILSKVIEFCRRKHFESPAAASLVDQKGIKDWEYEFLQVDKSASVHLKINSLMELTFQTLKDMAIGIAEQEVLKKSRIEKYYTTKEEEEEQRKTYRIPSDPLELNLGKQYGMVNDPLELNLGKQYGVVNDPPEERDFSILNDPPKRYI